MALGVACIGLYVVPLFFPPAAVPQPYPSLDATLLERLFPGVPGWWVACRFVALLAGALLIGMRLPLPLRMSGEGPSTLPPISSVALSIAAVFAAGHAASSFFVDHLPQWGQALYVGALFVPGLLVWIPSCRPSTWLQSIGTAMERGWPVVFFLVAWTAWRLWAVWGNPAIATPWDIWLEHGYMVEVIERDMNMLLSQHLVGLSDLRILAVGVNPFGPKSIPSLQTLQTSGVLWLAVAAAAAAWCAAHVISGRAALIAAVTVAMAPLTLGLTHWVFPFGLLPALVSVALGLLVEIWRRRSVTALVLFGAVCGLVATQAVVGFWVVPTGLAALWLASRPPRIPFTALLAAGFSFIAMAVPYLRSLDTDLMEVQEPFAVWTLSEDLSLEQIDWLHLPDVLELRLGVVDSVVGGLMAPFAFPRTALRQWGDTLLEPLSGVLVALGFVLCARLAWRRPIYWTWILAWLFVQLPVMLTSCYDRISPFRNLGLPVASAPFAALAFEAFYLRLGSIAQQVHLSWAVAVVCCVSGVLLYQSVTPRVLGASAMELILEAAGETPPDGMTVLKLGGTEVTFTRAIVNVYAETELSVSEFWNRASLVREGKGAPGEAIAAVMLWSPALETQCQVSRAICAQWPDATIYTIHSRSKLTRAFAARVAPATQWSPRVAPERWEAHSCASFPVPAAAAANRIWCAPDFTPREELDRRRKEYEAASRS